MDGRVRSSLDLPFPIMKFHQTFVPEPFVTFWDAAGLVLFMRRRRSA